MVKNDTRIRVNISVLIAAEQNGPILMSKVSASELSNSGYACRSVLPSSATTVND